MSDAHDMGSGVAVDVSRDGSTTTLTVAGELDISSIDTVEQALPVLEHGHRLVIDLRPLRFMDSTGLRLLMQLDLRARADGWALAIVRDAGTTADLLRLTRMDERLSVVDDPAELV